MNATLKEEESEVDNRREGGIDSSNLAMERGQKA
jgi:hypothetical protein